MQEYEPLFNANSTKNVFGEPCGRTDWLAENFGFTKMGSQGYKVFKIDKDSFSKTLVLLLKPYKTITCNSFFELVIIFSVPSGAESYTSFNAQRVFHPSLIVEMFDQCEIVEFSALADKLYRNVALNVFDNCQGAMNSACSLFIFKKVR